MALLTVAILVLQELARAARSAEKLLDTLNRELPITLQDLRLTGKELSDLSEEVSGSVQSARSVAQQVDQGLLATKAQAQKAQITTRSLLAGATAAFRVLSTPQRRPPNRRRRRPPTPPTSQPFSRQAAQKTPDAAMPKPSDSSPPATETQANSSSMSE